MSWDPLEEMRKIHREVDRLFSDFFGKPKALIPEGFREPLIDVCETDEEIIVFADIPGVEKENIKLNATEDSLEIKAEKRGEKKMEKAEYELRERKYLGFYRLISLPVKVDASKAKATYKNGVLEVRLPKIEAAKRVSVPVE